MEQYRPYPYCKCVPNVSVDACELYKLAKRYRANELVIGFLRGLSESYSNIVE